jgi:hypothetical protein
VKTGWFTDKSDRTFQRRPWLKKGRFVNDYDNDDDDDDGDKRAARSRFLVKNLTVVKIIKIFEAF